MFLTAVFGLSFGFVGSMPLAGPIAVLVFTRAIDGRFRTALFIGLGCAVAESVYAGLAFLGFSTLLKDYAVVVPISRALAAVILIALGFHFLRRDIHARPSAAPERRAGGFAAGFAITAFNPTLIGTWGAVAATLFSTGWIDFAPLLAIPFAIAVAIGIGGWYVVLVALVRRYRDRFRVSTLNRVIRVTGAALVLLGLWFAWRCAEVVLDGFI